MKKGQINIGYKARKVGFMDGNEKLIGLADRYSTIDYKSIIAYAAKAAAVPESSIEMAMEAIYDAMNYFVLNGHSVQIPNMGTFSLGISAKTAATEAEFTANFAQNLRRIKIRFLPDTELKQMIASTAILTGTVEDPNYQSDAVLAVRSSLFFAGNTAIPVVAGTACSLGPLSRLVFNGTRLTKDYLGTTPLTITFIKSDGSEEAVVIGRLNFSYNQLSATISGYNDRYVAIKGFSLKDKDGNVLVERTFAAMPDVATSYAVIIGGRGYAPGSTVPYKAGEAIQVRMIGFNMNNVAKVMAGAVEADLLAGSSDQIRFEFTPAASGNYPLALYEDAEGAAVSTFNLSVGEAGGVSVTAVTANGDALINGGTTNITAGNNYNIVISGQGLSELQASDFVLPVGSSITIVSQSTTQIQATISNAQAGDFKIKDGDTVIFTAALVAVTPGVTVSGYKKGASSTVTALNVSLMVESNDAFDITLVGTNLDDLTTESFSGQKLTDLSYNPQTGQLTGAKSQSGSTSLVITANSTTVATITVIDYQNGDNDDDGLDKD